MAASKAAVLFGLCVGQVEAGPWWQAAKAPVDHSTSMVAAMQQVAHIRKLSAKVKSAPRRLQTDAIPEACAQACPALADFVKFGESKTAQFSTGSPPPEQMSGAMQEVFGAMCDYKDGFACAFKEASCASLTEAAADEKDPFGMFDPFLMMKEPGCVCDACPNTGEAMGGMMGMILAAFAGLATGEQMSEKEQQMQSLQMMCPLVEPISCVATSDTCKAFATTFAGSGLDGVANAGPLCDAFKSGALESGITATATGDDMSCMEIAMAYERQGCCGQPGKVFDMPNARRLQGTSQTGPVFCRDVKVAYRQKQCCSETSGGDMDGDVSPSTCWVIIGESYCQSDGDVSVECCSEANYLIQDSIRNKVPPASPPAVCGMDMSKFETPAFSQCLESAFQAAVGPSPSADSAISHKADSSGCDITFHLGADASTNCYAPGLGDKCCTYFIGLMSKGTPDEDYQNLLEAAIQDGTCSASEMPGLSDSSFQSCLTNLDSSSDMTQSNSTEILARMTFETADGNCKMTLNGDSCTIQAMGETCCGFFVNMVKSGISTEEYPTQIGLAMQNGDCKVEEMAGMQAEEFTKCFDEVGKKNGLL
eukprot:TRINITY_DN16430_c0_g1_i1.p1 TRINITY_DN16430_c0_g1~~TRINITY_DN16430_c0_g1_i1.p1  ORF type:complete len:593 (-),score=133.46 TRINITY_DN16430_c0_g1_i1:404-2182(-)